MDRSRLGGEEGPPVASMALLYDAAVWGLLEILFVTTPTGEGSWAEVRGAAQITALALPCISTHTHTHTHNFGDRRGSHLF